MFKKFEKFIESLRESESKPDSPDYSTCDRCGEEKGTCTCYDDDYYDAKIDHYTPKGKTKKGNHGKDSTT